MRVLLDECLSRRLRSYLVGHEIQTVPEVGWAGKKNGELLNLAAGAFDALITIDPRLTSRTSDSEAGKRVAIITLQARSNRLEDLIPLAPHVSDALAHIEPGQLQRIS